MKIKKEKQITIRLSDDTYNRIRAAQLPRESYNDTLMRLLKLKLNAETGKLEKIQDEPLDDDDII